MSGVSKWEIGGIPATVAFYAAYRLGVFGSIPVEMLPDVMTLAFIGAQVLRAGGQWWISRQSKG